MIIIARQKYLRNSSFFKNIDTPEKAYWLGLLYADGYLNFTYSRYAFGIQLKSACRYLLEQLKVDLEYEGPLYHRERKTNVSVGLSRTDALEVHDHQLVDDLIRHGFKQGKNNRSFPTLDSVPENLQFHFIRGVVDGDGWIGKSEHYESRCPTRLQTKYTVGVSGPINVVKEIRRIWNVEHCPLRKSYNEKGELTLTQLNVGGRHQIRPILANLYNGATRFMKEKYDKYCDYLKHCTKYNSRAS